MSGDGVNQLVTELATADGPGEAWLAAHVGSGDPVARAWAASVAPHAMVRLLAITQNEDVDRAAQAAIRAAADALGKRKKASAELRARADSPSACGELANLLFGVWRVALADADDLEQRAAKIAAAVRAVVRRVPVLADLAPAPRTAKAPLPGAFDDAAFSNGRVISPESFGRTGPELGGLACERIFGTWRPRSLGPTEDDRDARWGHIELAHPCAHPVVANARLAILPVVPPHYRRPTKVSVEELRQYARKRRAELEAREDLCDPPEKILAESGLDDPDAIDKPGMREHKLNAIYRAVINIDRRVRRLVELDAPARVLDEQRAQLDAWSAQLSPALRAHMPADVDAAWLVRALGVAT